MLELPSPRRQITYHMPERTFSRSLPHIRVFWYIRHTKTPQQMHMRLNVTKPDWPVGDKNRELEIVRRGRRAEKMKAIEKNDSGDMSAQGPAPIYLHKCRGSDGEIQSEDVQEDTGRAQSLSPQPSSLVWTQFLCPRWEHRLHYLKQKAPKPSVTTGLESASDRIRAVRP